MTSPAVTITGTLTDSTNTPIKGKVVFTLCGFGNQIPRIVGTAILAKLVYEADAATNGTWSVTLWGNYQITPGTFYSVAIYPGNNAYNVTSVGEYQLLTAGTFDLSNLTPRNPTPFNPIPSAGGGISGTIAAGQIAVGTGTGILGGDSQFSYVNSGNPTLTLGTSNLAGTQITNSNGGDTTTITSSLSFGGTILLKPGGFNGLQLQLIALGTPTADFFGAGSAGSIHLTRGLLTISGTSSGSATIGAAATAGTPNRMNLPTTTGTSGQVLTTDGGNPQQLSWVSPGVLSSGQVAFGSVTNVITGSSNFQYLPGTGSLTLTAPAGGATADIFLVSNSGPKVDLNVGNTGQFLIAGSTGYDAVFSNTGLSITPQSGGTGALLYLLGSTGGASIGAATAAGTPNRINLPTTTGTAGQVLSTDGNNPQQTSWITPPSTFPTMTLTGATPTGTSGQLSLGTTTTTSASAGSNGDVPAQVVGYLEFDLAGTKYKLPYYAV